MRLLGSKPTWTKQRRDMRFLLCLALALMMGGAGCGKWGARQRVAVHGIVTVEGRPVEAGAIAFVPVDDNTGPTAGGNIENGKYSIPAERGPMPGPNRVNIYGTRKTGRKVPSQLVPNLLVDEIVDVVSSRYHTNSPLKHEIQTGQGNLDFRLDAK